MLLPRFTIRTLLVILTASAAVFVMVGTAYRGQYWAWGVTIAIFSLLVTAVVHAAWFGLVTLIAQISAPEPTLANLQAVRHLCGDIAEPAANETNREPAAPTAQ